MSPAFLSDANFWQRLFDLDCDLAVEVREAGCPHCGSVLHSAPYPRKPRGVPRSVLGERYGWRLRIVEEVHRRALGMASSALHRPIEICRDPSQPQLPLRPPILSTQRADLLAEVRINAWLGEDHRLGGLSRAAGVLASVVATA